MVSAIDDTRAPWLKALDTSLLAIGVPCGSFAGSELQGQGMYIRLGGQFLAVSPAAFAAWWQLLRPRTPEDICRWIESERLGDGPHTLSELHKQGLLVNWTDDYLADMTVVAAMRLVPIGIGVGSQPDEPEHCAIRLGLAGGVVIVDSVSYTVWAVSDGKTPLGEACRRAATALGLQVDEVWARFYTALPDLTGGGMALLDRA